MKRLRPPLLGYDCDPAGSRYRQQESMLSDLLKVPVSQRSRRQTQRIERLRSAVSVKARLRSRPTQ